MSRVAGGVEECPGPGKLLAVGGIRGRELQKLRHDKSGDMRAELVRGVFSTMAVYQRVRHLQCLNSTCDIS